MADGRTDELTGAAVGEKKVQICLSIGKRDGGRCGSGRTLASMRDEFLPILRRSEKRPNSEMKCLEREREREREVAAVVVKEGATGHGPQRETKLNWIKVPI